MLVKACFALLHSRGKLRAVPQQLTGATLFRSRYIVPEDTEFTVQAPACHHSLTSTKPLCDILQARAGSPVYLFSEAFRQCCSCVAQIVQSFWLNEAHRDGGFPMLGWQQEDAGRFHWQDLDGNPAQKGRWHILESTHLLTPINPL